MSPAEELLAKIVEANPWERETLLDGVADFYGAGFATLIRAQVDAELARRAEQERKRQERKSR